MELCYVRTISSLHLGIKKKIKTDFVLNIQWTTLQTAVLLRKWGRGDKHPPTCVYNFSEDDKFYCPSYFFSGFKAQTAPDCRRKVPTDHFSFTDMQSSLNLGSCILFFLCANRIIQHMASVSPASLPEVLLHSLGEDRLFWSSLLKLVHPLKASLSTKAALCDRGFRWNTAWRYSNRQTA